MNLLVIFQLHTLQATVTFPIFLPKSIKARNVRLFVSSERITETNDKISRLYLVKISPNTSKSFIIGTGLKKCNPPKFSLRFKLAAMSVSLNFGEANFDVNLETNLREEVLVAMKESLGNKAKG